MPKPVQIGAATVLHGDCVALIPTLGLVDAIVTDPPYHLHVHGGGPNAGNIANRGQISLPFAAKSGFMGQRWDGGDIAFQPETWAAIGTALKPGGYLLAFGGTRTHHRIWCAIEDAGFVIQDTIMWLYGQGFPKGRTQLKPAFEPICVAYKPGGPRTLQIDECRISGTKDGGNWSGRQGECNWRMRPVGERSSQNTHGRWPANLAHDGSDEVMAAFAAFGEHPGCKSPSSNDRDGDRHVFGTGLGRQGPIYSDLGSAARFFYCAKASKADRAGSKHPTVKPVALMRWLVRFVTPPGGLVLDPFAGSGTTGAAALAEGRRAILIEREAEYIADIKRRLKTVSRPVSHAA